MRCVFATVQRPQKKCVTVKMNFYATFAAYVLLYSAFIATHLSYDFLKRNQLQFTADALWAGLALFTVLGTLLLPFIIHNAYKDGTTDAQLAYNQYDKDDQ